jgi:hypothetical protein
MPHRHALQDRFDGKRVFFSETLRHWVDPRGNDNTTYPRMKTVYSRFVSRGGAKRSEQLAKTTTIGLFQRLMARSCKLTYGQDV